MADFPLPISLGILSWGAHKTLLSTLDTLAKENFFSLFSESFIFFQEMTDEDVLIAQRYGLQVIGSPDNLGIMGGMKKIAEHSSSKYTLHLENDIQLLRNIDFARQQLLEAVHYLEKGQVDCYRLIERKCDIGYLRHKYLRYYPAEELGHEDSLLKKTRRFFNRHKAKRLLGHCVYFSDNPELIAPSHIVKIGDNHWSVDSEILNWSNQAPLYNNEWFLGEILPFAESNPSSRTVNGKASLERELNRKWWRKKHFRIGMTEGLFGHIRRDRPANDEKHRPETI